MCLPCAVALRVPFGRPLLHVIDAAERGFLRPLWALTRQDKQRENIRLTRLQENNWNEHVAMMENILYQYWLSVTIWAKAWSGETKVKKDTIKIRRWP